MIHSSEYRERRGALRASSSITVVGSGQSAAEIYRDLLEGARADGYRLDWMTRSPRFFPMEYTKLTLEMTSPEYTDHFHGLPLDVRNHLGREQRSLYKGISGDLVDDIYDTLYRLSAEGPVPTTLLTDTEVTAAEWDGERYRLRLRHGTLGREHERETEALVLATGYAAQTPAFLSPIAERLDWDARGRLAVARDYSIDGGRGRIFVQNGEEHTHGLTAPDLGFGAWRNSSILASITGREIYPIERRIAFQDFGVPADAAQPRDGLRAGGRALTTLTGLGVALVPADPRRDAGTLQRWLSDPHAAFWGMGDLDVAAVADYVAGVVTDSHQDAWLGLVDGEPTFFAETYDPARVLLTEVHAARPGDLGMHLLIAPPAGHPRHGLTDAVFTAVMSWCFDALGALRIVVEPDVRNEAIRRKNVRAGFTELAVVLVPEGEGRKTAMLSVCTREDFTGSELGRTEREGRA